MFYSSVLVGAMAPVAPLDWPVTICGTVTKLQLWRSSHDARQMSALTDHWSSCLSVPLGGEISLVHRHQGQQRSLHIVSVLLVDPAL